MGQDVEGERMEVIELDGNGRLATLFFSWRKSLSCSDFLNSCFPPRPPVLRGCAVPPRVHVTAHQAVAAVPRPAARLGREAAELLAERMPSVSQVSPRRPLALSANRVVLGFFFLKASLCSRDTYSDRSGSSTPDSEISELKLPSISNE